MAQKVNHYQIIKNLLKPPKESRFIRKIKVGHINQAL